MDLFSKDCKAEMISLTAVCVVVVITCIAKCIPCDAVTSPLWHELDDTYTFDDFVQDFQKSYATVDEYQQRKLIFEQNLRNVLLHNAGVISDKASGTYQGHVLGINHLADLQPNELPTGLAKGLLRNYRSGDKDLRVVSSRALHDSSMFALDPISELPKSVDWRAKGVTSPVKKQGFCGSCWAFASTAVLESHVAIHTGKLFSLSEQELVSCVANPQHCGGNGGCAGSVASLAYEHVRDYGMVQEWDFGYQSYDGKTVTCDLENATSVLREPFLRGKQLAKGQYYKKAVVSVMGHVILEKNSYTALMNAVAKLGPVAVSVACNQWHLYAGGVFSTPFNHSDPSTMDVNHLVALEGYGTDVETNEDYWLVRNSWSPMWGENGYIRLKRVNPDTLNDPDTDDCGMDTTPADGDGCTIDDQGRSIQPPAVKICGTSGILSHSVVPLGAHLIA